MSAGTMTQQWTVWCARCQKWEMVSGSKRSVANHVKSIGWSKRKDGWVCLECYRCKQCGKPWGEHRNGYLGGIECP